MTRALLTPALRKELSAAGLFLLIDAGNLTVSVYSEVEKVSEAGVAYDGVQKIGTLSYSANSVDYDELKRLVQIIA